MSKLNLDSILNHTEEDSTSLITETVVRTSTDPVITFDMDTVLREWSYRCDKGYPEIGNVSDMWHLQEILKEMGIENPFPQITEAPSGNPAAAVKTVKKKSLTAKQSPSTIEGSNTPELKEGLVIYFSTQPKKILDIAAEKASNPKSTSVLTLNTTVPSKYYGTKSAELVSKAIDFLNENSITPNNSRLYLNAISIARKIQESLTVEQVRQESIDRGDLYNSIRKHAVKLVSDMGVAIKEDKWCPADIYIYKDSISANQALQTNTLNVGDMSLNAMFNSEFNDVSGIVGISLKEEKAQAGKATSFREILTRETNYPDALKLNDVQKNTMELLYNLNALKFSNAKSTPVIKVGYISEAIRIIESKKIKNTDKLKNLLIHSLSLIFKGNTKGVFGPRGGYNKENTRKSFINLGLSELPLDPKLIPEINSFSETVKSDAINTYNRSRKAFISTLNKLHFKTPGDTPNINKLDSETLYKKSSCYLVAEYLLSGINAEKLHLPPAYKSIMSQKNAFVAMTAYAVGMGGISPTFFKLVGSSTGTGAHLEPFYGDGFLNVSDNNSTKIVDTDEYKGFYVTFVADVTIGTGKKTKKKGSYKVTLDFRYAGDQLNIEVSDLKQV